LKKGVTAKLAADVRLQPVPADWGPGVSKYQYVCTAAEAFPSWITRAELLAQTSR